MQVATIMTVNPLTIAVDASLDEAMLAMDNEDIRHLPVVRDGALAGVISSRDLLELTGWLSPREREVLEAPDGPVGDHMHEHVVTVGPDDSVAKAVLRMATHKIGCLPVVDGENLMGILTELDVLMGFLEFRRLEQIPASADPPVSRYMTTDVQTISPEATGEELVAIMKHGLLRHVPVVNGGELIGFVSDRDVRLAVGRGTLDGVAVREIMTPIVFTAAPDEPLSVVGEAMVKGKLGAVPVVLKDGALCGIVALPDLFAACLEGFESIGKANVS